MGLIVLRPGAGPHELEMSEVGCKMGSVTVLCTTCFYLFVIDFNVFSTIVVLENIRSSIMSSDDQGNSTHTHLNLSLVSHNLAIQPQHELLHDVVADLLRAPSIRTSH